MKFLLQQRFSYFDLLWILMAINLFVDNRPWIALGAAVVGAVVSVGLELLFKASPWKKKPKEPWQLAADAGRYVEAIKLHRNAYQTTLKDAKDIVDIYRQRNLK